MHLEGNKELALAWDYVTKTSMNVFLTGKAGTGKTTFLKKVVSDCPKRKIVLAPTGVAALNAGGVTLHSFFQLPFGLFLPDFEHLQAHDKQGRYKFHRKKLKLIKSVELMIIDEVSMLRADVMDELDALLRKLRRSPKPFGGVQLLMIGDVQQLSPVVKEEEWEVMSRYYDSPYFFDSKVLKTNPYRLVELTHIYRQKDSEFIDILGAVRENRMTRELLDKLNSRYIPDYQAPDGCITLCTHNQTAKEINDSRLEAIQAPEYKFTAVITGNFPESMYPQDVDLVLRKGAQVMFTKNDPNPERLYVNGTLGVVSYIDKDNITVRLENGGEVEVEPLPWENLKYDINEETKEIVSEIDGLFTQYPLRTAWAITIHKSQGLTFDKAVIDASKSFSHGQVYVALSRCRTLEGMVLKNKLSYSSIIKDNRVDQFSEYVAGSLPSSEDLENDRRAYYLGVLKDLFDLEALRRYFDNMVKFSAAAFSELYPKAMEQWLEAREPFTKEIYEVSLRFSRSLDRIVGEDYLSSDYLQERVKKASVYFKAKAMEVLLPLVKASCKVDFDDAAKKKIFKQYFTNYTENLFLNLMLWNYTAKGFELDGFLEKRAVILTDLVESGVPKLIQILSKELNGEIRKEQLSANDSQEAVENLEMFNLLKAWRGQLAKDQGIPAYRIMTQKTLAAVANACPRTEAELLAIKGIGKSFMNKYASEVLDIITSN